MASETEVHIESIRDTVGVHIESIPDIEWIQSEMNFLTMALSSIAKSITPLDTQPGTDATGGYTASLTEAVMGMTAAGVKIAESGELIADSLDSIAHAISAHHGDQ